MVEIVHPVAHQITCKLEEAYEQLAAARDEITSLRDEVARLHQHMPSQFKEKPESPTNTILAPSEHKNIESSEPRYAQATESTERRSAKPITQTQHPVTTSAITLTLKPISYDWGRPQWDCTGGAFPNKYQCRDGCLVKLPIGYLNATTSSSIKQCPKPLRWPVEPETASTEAQLEGYPSSRRAEGSSAQNSDDNDSWRNKIDYSCRSWPLRWLHKRKTSAHKLSDTGYRDLIDLHVLVPATRLYDDQWLKSPLNHMLIDDAQQARLLTQGRETAQKCLWNFAEKRMPGKNPWAGWQQVRFEWAVLSISWGQEWHEYYRSLNFRASEAALVWKTMQDVINLSGLYPFNLSRVDKHLKSVQKMAIQLYDEQGALEARRLRDELRQAAQNTFDDLVAFGTLASLPFAGYPWKHHHERVLRGLCTRIYHADVGRGRLDEHFPGEVGRVAEDWAWHNNRNGSAYEPPVYLAACPRTPPKRRQSSSSHRDFGVVAGLMARIKADREWQQRNGSGPPYDVPERLVEAHGQSEPEDTPSGPQRRCRSCSI
ncbi:hypothetical protein Daus18300_012181 [Diaporthe australafricana]|uniref:Uncharacterized protein n=1 Tax=Diaporthe australafricana TaxID=127596 RepID=A0ABR3W3L5_9PEZI